MGNEALIIERLKKVELLPTFPNIVHDVMRVIEDPMSSASDIAKHMDASMMGKILQIANSAYFSRGGARRIKSIEHAIALIGYEQLTHIILHMPFLIFTKKDDEYLNINGYLTHSALCGVISKCISDALHLGNPNETFIGGILHDMGMIIIYTHFYEEWKDIVSLITSENISRVEAERKVLSYDHGEIGAMLLDIWNVSKSISDCVRYHHSITDVREDVENAASVYLGNIFSKQINFHLIENNLVDFMTTHRGIIEEIKKFKSPIEEKEELNLFKKIYDAINEYKRIYRGIEDDG